MNWSRIVVAAGLLGAASAAWGQGAAALTLEGRLQPRKVVTVGAQVSGPVAEVRVEEGDAVQRDELLARIDPGQYRARLDEAKARVDKARAVAEDSARQLDRQQKIYNRGLSSSRDLEVAQRDAARDRAEVEAAEAAVRSARIDLGHTEIRSPLDGVVLARKVEPGETVIANLRPPMLFRVATSLDRLDLVVAVREDMLGKLREGDQVRVEVPALTNYRTTGEVMRIAQAPRKGKGEPTYAVRIRVDNDKGKLRPGMKGRAVVE
ncbi:MAG TPA: efflux RND transporter periplasmic adaptor subunit [Gammaproteobacteria bacterium]|nr:efflux RND transporter periplasmic adaptor subunit [Gammaproteobacteria bacterium]